MTPFLLPFLLPPARTVYYQDDHEGSVTHLTDASGNILEYYRYDAFGRPFIYNSTGQPLNASAFGNRFMFTGREYVEKFGVYEYRNRAYHPGLGRFMSEDPKLFDAGDYNLFRYVGNDPLDRVDPMGLVQAAFDNGTYQQIISHIQGITNDRIALGYGATAVAGLFQSMNKLQQAVGSQGARGGGADNQTSGKFTVSARALNANPMFGMKGASASEFTTIYEQTAGPHYSYFNAHQRRSDGTIDSSGKVKSWTPFHDDKAFFKPASITQRTNGVKVVDNVGAFKDSASLPGQATILHGQRPALSFNPTAIRIEVSISGVDKDGEHPGGSHIFSGQWNEHSVPHYEGVDSGR